MWARTSRMHWLYCFWGVGVSISPYIMSSCLISGAGWQAGYRWVAILQAALTAILLASLPLWRSRKKSSGAEKEAAEPAAEALGVRGALRIPGVREVLVGFFCYCALESSTGLWASSYLVLNRGIAVEVAARWASLFYLGITFGRFLSGTIANKLTDRSIIRLGLALIFLGILAILFPAAPQIVPLCGLIVIGLGCAPVYPAIIHETPSNFGAENSQAVIGIQMAGAYVGATVMPPLFGIIADYVNIGWYPVWLLLILALMTVMLERKNRIVAAAGR